MVLYKDGASEEVSGGSKGAVSMFFAFDVVLLFISMCYCLRTRHNLKCVKILDQFINKRDEGLGG